MAGGTKAAEHGAEIPNCSNRIRDWPANTFRPREGARTRYLFANGSGPWPRSGLTTRNTALNPCKVRRLFLNPKDADSASVASPISAAAAPGRGLVRRLATHGSAAIMVPIIAKRRTLVQWFCVMINLAIVNCGNLRVWFTQTIFVTIFQKIFFRNYFHGHRTALPRSIFRMSSLDEISAK